MNIFILVLFGTAGLISGYKVPDISYKIMEYKKGKENIKKGEVFLDSNILKALFSIFNGITWTISTIRMENILSSLLICLLITIGLITIFIDIKIRIIPNENVLTIIIVGILLQITYFGPKALIGASISMVIMMVVFTSVAGFVGFGKVGAGDVKLAGAMGIALGYPLIITATGVMAFVLLIFILVGMAFKKIYLSTMLPMAPFMLSGLIISLLTLFK